MSALLLLPVGGPDGRVLEQLRRGLAAAFRVTCEILPQRLTPDCAFHGERQQYHSTEILKQMHAHIQPGCWRLLGVTSVDLYMPILTFVFGEAELGNTCALVSTRRLTQEFYGLPSDTELLHQRMLKEAVHELGHTFGLTHCRDYDCVMAASHSVEWIDIKSSSFCEVCANQVGSALPRDKKFLGIF